MHIQIDRKKLVIYDTDPVLTRKRNARIVICTLFCTAGAFAIYDTYFDQNHPWNTILLGTIFLFSVFMVLFELSLHPPNSKLGNKINNELLVADTEGLVLSLIHI